MYCVQPQAKDREGPRGFGPGALLRFTVLREGRPLVVPVQSEVPSTACIPMQARVVFTTSGLAFSCKKNVCIFANHLQFTLSADEKYLLSFHLLCAAHCQAFFHKAKWAVEVAIICLLRLVMN